MFITGEAALAPLPAAAISAAALAAALAVAFGLVAAPDPVIFTDLICGGRFGIWYETLTSSTTGVSFAPLPLVKVSRYWKNRATGDVIGSHCDAGTSLDHGDQPSSDSSPMLLLRVATVSAVPPGSEPRRCSLPNLLICVASSTGLVNVPLLA